MEQTRNKRRNFMMALGLGAAGALSALLMRKPPEVAAPVLPVAVAPAPVKGYHVSEHVKRYYRTTRV